MVQKKVFFKNFKFKSSLRMKLISGFLLVVLLMGSISIVSFFKLRSSIAQYDNMIETMLMINDISNISQEISPIITNYILNRDVKDKQKIADSFSRIQNNIALLKIYISDEKGKSSFEGVERLSPASVLSYIFLQFI